MASEKVDAGGWGERDDWAAPPPAAPATQPRRRSPLFLVAGLLLFAALMTTLVLRRADTAREQAEEAEQAALDARVQVSKAKMRAARAGANATPGTDAGPKLDPAEAERLMAADAASLNTLGLYRLDSTDDLDGAVAALQEAAKLDPRYAPNLALALKRKAERDRKRDRVTAAGAAGGGPAIAVTPDPGM